MQGTWSCSLNVMTVLASIQQLLTEPNADDSLVPDIVRLTLATSVHFVTVWTETLIAVWLSSIVQAEEFKNNREIFNAKAKQLAARARPGENSSPNKTVRYTAATSRAYF